MLYDLHFKISITLIVRGDQFGNLHITKTQSRHIVYSINFMLLKFNKMKKERRKERRKKIIFESIK